VSDETLMTAAHRLNRFFRIDMQNGGLVVDETLAALETLSRQVAAYEDTLVSVGADHLGSSSDSSLNQLLVASRECVKLLNLDMSKHGGMVSIMTEISFDTLVKAIRAAGGRQ
jgi:hypothetical protein